MVDTKWIQYTRKIILWRRRWCSDIDDNDKDDEDHGDDDYYDGDDDDYTADNNEV